MNSIYYYTFNDIRYLSDIDFKGQIQNSQKMVYLILGHPVVYSTTLLYKVNYVLYKQVEVAAYTRALTPTPGSTATEATVRLGTGMKK